jgi:uncharacterized protein (TIGR02145 family)
MKKSILKSAFLLGIAISLISCGDSQSDGSSLTKESDNTGRKLKEVTIGNQTWHAENLNVTTFRNGDPIPQANTPEEWNEAADRGKPVCRVDSKTGCVYYNYHVIIDERGLAPEGWRIAGEEDWKALEKFCEDYKKEHGFKMGISSLLQSKDTQGDEKSYDEFGFSAISCGQISISGTYDEKSETRYWGSEYDIEEYEDGNWKLKSRWYTISSVGISDNYISHDNFVQEGNVVRCIKKTPEELKVGIYKVSDAGAQLYADRCQYSGGCSREKYRKINRFERFRITGKADVIVNRSNNGEGVTVYGDDGAYLPIRLGNGVECYILSSAGKELIEGEPVLEENNILHSANKEKVKVEVFKINDPDGYSNLRDAPKGKVLQKVMDTESFEVVGEQAGYKKVKLSNGVEGFIHSSRVVKAE